MPADIAFLIHLFMDGDGFLIRHDRRPKFRSGDGFDAILREFFESDDPPRKVPPPVELIIAPDQKSVFLLVLHQKIHAHQRSEAAHQVENIQREARPGIGKVGGKFLD